MVSTLRNRDLLSISDLNREEVLELLELAIRVKKDPRSFSSDLAGKVMVMIFEKPSLRTRVTFESGMATLGGTGIYLSPDQVRMGEREPVCDVARNLSRWVQVIVARTFRHSTIEELAREASIPVINALSDWEHPCQALADFQTIREYFGPEPVPLCFVGDGNNVCHSLMLLSGMMGYEFRVACPVGYEPNEKIRKLSQQYAEEAGSKIIIDSDVHKLVSGSRVVYTDVWASMGQEKEAEKRAHDFRDYQLNENLMKLAAGDARVMHCLPAHRGEEITSEVMDSPASILLDQAENRLHLQKALLLKILGEL